MADTTLTLHVFEGTRLPLTNRDILVSLWDGNQRRVHWAYHRSPDIRFTIPLADNFVDNYRVVVSTDGYRDAGQTSVVLTEDPSDLALMLLPKKPAFAFAPLDTIASVHESLSRLVVEHLQSRYDDASELTYKRLQNEF